LKKQPSKKQLFTTMIICGFLAVVAGFYARYLSSFSFASSYASRHFLESGCVVQVYQNRRHNIYIETTNLDRIIRQNSFVFTNLYNGDVVVVSTSNNPAPRAYFIPRELEGEVSDNRDYTAGRPIGAVRLPVGTYRVEFEPLRENQRIVWDFYFWPSRPHEGLIRTFTLASVILGVLAAHNLRLLQKRARRNF